MSPGPIISVAQMRAMDAAAPGFGVSTLTLMENAGAAVAEAVIARYPPQPVAVLCGPGGNGGDGFVAARRLLAAGWPVWVETETPLAALTGDAAVMAQAWTGPVHRLGERCGAAGSLVIDALLGAGLSRPLTGEAARLAALLPQERMVAVDVPSGLAGDGAAPLGGVCFEAALTVTFEAKKPAHVLEPGRFFCGEVVTAPIGMPAGATAAAGLPIASENGPALWGSAFPKPGRGAHKHARGHVMVMSGGATHTGAARLAAAGALRAGAGLVTVLSPPEAVLVNAAHLTAIMLRKVASVEETAAAARGAHAVVIGPAAGVHEGTRARVLALVKEPAPLVLDADALTVFQDDPAALFAVLRPGDVLTPHVGEFNRLFPGLLSASVHRIEAARAAAVKAGAVLLLKGPDTTIAAPDGRCAVNLTGTPYLATAGSGDVLAGVIAGLMAQGMKGFEAACAGAWLHGRCGEALGPGLIAEDLPAALAEVLRRTAL